jgi:hypothetical protein
MNDGSAVVDVLLLNRSLGGVLEFTAEEGKAYIPLWVRVYIYIVSI